MTDYDMTHSANGICYIHPEDNDHFVGTVVLRVTNYIFHFVSCSSPPNTRFGIMGIEQSVPPAETKRRLSTFYYCIELEAIPVRPEDKCPKTSDFYFVKCGYFNANATSKVYCEWSNLSLASLTNRSNGFIHDDGSGIHIRIMVQLNYDNPIYHPLAEINYDLK